MTTKRQAAREQVKLERAAARAKIDQLNIKIQAFEDRNRSAAVILDYAENVTDVRLRQSLALAAHDLLCGKRGRHV